jgi:hypothetical protein
MAPVARRGSAGAQICYGVTVLDATPKWQAIREFHGKSDCVAYRPRSLRGEIQLAVRSAMPEHP